MVHIYCCCSMRRYAYRTLRNVDHLAGFAEKATERPTDRDAFGSVSVSVSVSIPFVFVW